MKGPHQRLIFVATVAVFIVSALIYAASTGVRGNLLRPLPQASRDRIIERKTNAATGDEPVEITLVKTKRKSGLAFGRTFQDDDEWFQGVTITAKNVSTKNITYINIHFTFDRPDDSEGNANPPLVHSLVFGTKNATASQKERLAPGSSVALSLGDLTYASLKRALAKLGYPSSLKRVQMNLSEVAFDDDTLWANGYWFRRDPTDPQNWIRI